MKTKEYTKKQVKQKFLENIKASCRYWNSLEDKTDLEKLEGLAFSILVMLDGGSYLPGFIVAPYPHEDDKGYAIEEGYDFYYPQNHESNVNCDIAGDLHELFTKIK